MHLLLLGKNGQVGWELAKTLGSLGKLTAAGRDQADLTDLRGLAQFVRQVGPDVIVNAAAYTNVDKAETERDLAAKVNGDAPGLLAGLAADHQAHLIHFSTDYVFDGTKRSPYVESDPTNPVNYYGQTKLDGERQVLESGASHWIFRTSWVYSLRRPSFISKLLEWSRERDTLRIVADRFGSPTWAPALALATAKAISKHLSTARSGDRPPSGVYHVACEGGASRFDLGSLFLEQRLGRGVVNLEPASSDEFPLPATRPAYTVLNCDAFKQTFGIRLPTWQEAISDATKRDGQIQPPTGPGGRPG